MRVDGEDARTRPRGHSWLAAALLVALVSITGTACEASKPHATPNSTEVVPRELRFVRTEAVVKEACENDSRILGWAAPCPMVLPGIAHVQWCTGSDLPTSTVTAKASCVYTGGEPPIPMFYLDINFPGPAPLGAATIRHLVIEAFPKGSPGVLDPPCANPKPLSALTTRIGKLASFRCLQPTPAQDARVTHGEAIHSHHDLVRWHRRGIVYVVSVHRSGLNTRQILQVVAENIVTPES